MRSENQSGIHGVIFDLKIKLSRLPVIAVCLGMIGAGFFLADPKIMLRNLATGFCGAGLIEAFQVRPYWERDRPKRAVNRLIVVSCLTIGVTCLCVALSL